MQWYVFARRTRALAGAMLLLAANLGVACKPSIITSGLTSASANLSGATTPDGVIVTDINANPANGSIAAGSTVTLTGSGFTSDLQVSINGVSCAPVVVPSSTTLTCTATATIPAGGPTIVVTKPGSSSSSGSSGSSASTSSPAPAPAPAPAPVNAAPTAAGFRCPGAILGVPYNAHYCTFTTLSDDGGVSGLTISKSSASTCSFLTSGVRNNDRVDLTGTTPASGAGTTCNAVFTVSDGTNTVTTTATVPIGNLVTISANTTIASGNVATFSGNSVVVLTGQTLTLNTSSAITLTGLELQGTGQITHTGCTTTGCTAVNLTVLGSASLAAGSAIHGDDKGYLGGGRTGSDTVVNPSNAGLTYPNTTTGGAPAADSVGGSHAGRGGVGQSDVGVPGRVYGSISSPTTHGGGGAHGVNACCSHFGGNGGGVVYLDTLNTLTLNGRISADGGVGVSVAAPAGAGGSVWVIADSLVTTGTGCGGTGGCLSANGSNSPGDANWTAPGGGGRVALHYGSLTGFTVSSTFLRAFGGTSAGPHHAGAGTAFAKAKSQTSGNLIVDNNGTSSYVDAIYDVSGPVSAVTATTLSTTGLILVTNDLVGKTLKPDVETNTTCTITSNTDTTITVSGCNPSTSSAVGKIFAVLDYNNRFDGVTIQGVSKTMFSQLVTTNSGGTGFVSLSGSGTYLTTLGATTVGAGRLDITTNTLTVGAGSLLHVNGKGYLGGAQTGSDGLVNGNAGRTYPNTTVGGAPASRASGGNHAGRGGSGNMDYTVPGRVYGSVAQPSVPGGGGARESNNNAGGNGGGVLKITSSNVVVNGTISANGAAGGTTASPGGAGGSIWIATTTLSTTGTGCAGTGGCITANGDASGTDGNWAGPGGGGRVALHYSALSTFAINSTFVRAFGGVNASPYDAGAGTIYTKTPSQTYGSLLIDNNGTTATAEAVYDVSGFVQGVSTNTLTTTSLLMVVDSLAGKTLKPNLESTSTCAIVSNTESVLTVSGCDLTVLTAPSKAFTVTDFGHRFDSVDIKGTSHASFGELTTDALTVQGAARATVYSKLTATNTGATGSITLSGASTVLTGLASTTVGSTPLEIVADTLNVGASAQLHMDGKGYLGGAQAGPDGVVNGNAGQIYPNTTVGGAPASRAAGGSHGGRGGAGNSDVATSGLVYGSFTQPTTAGGGGARESNNNAGGNGGGAIKVTATNVIVNGTISANGGYGGTTASPGGAGGSIWITTSTLSTTGTGCAGTGGCITANGDASGIDGNWAAPGGGGRIALYYSNLSGFSINGTFLRAFGGANASSHDGGAGTIYTKVSSDLNGSLRCDNNGTTGEHVTALTLGSNTTLKTLTSANTCALYMNNDASTLTVTDNTFIGSTGGSFTRPSAVSCSFAGPDTPTTY